MSADVDPQEFGEVKSQVEALGKTLDRHLMECTESNKNMVKVLETNTAKLNKLFLAVAVLVALLVGMDGVKQLLVFFA